jgi:hypothetical protein
MRRNGGRNQLQQHQKMSDTALVQLDAARLALSTCKTAMEAKQIADAADVMRVYLARTHASAEAVNQATEIRLLAERQMGEFLKAMPKSEGGRPKETGAREEPVLDTAPATLADMGITKKQSARAQKLAEIPAEEFQARIEAAKDEGKLTTAAVITPSPAPIEVSPGIELMGASNQIKNKKPKRSMIPTDKEIHQENQRILGNLKSSWAAASSSIRVEFMEWVEKIKFSASV